MYPAVNENGKSSPNIFCYNCGCSKTKSQIAYFGMKLDDHDKI